MGFLFENSMIAEHETVHLCEPFILAALGWAKGIKEVSGFVNCKTLTIACHTQYFLEYFIGDLEPFIPHPYLVHKVPCMFLLPTAVW